MGLAGCALRLGPRSWPVCWPLAEGKLASRSTETETANTSTRPLDGSEECPDVVRRQTQLTAIIIAPADQAEEVAHLSEPRAWMESRTIAPVPSSSELQRVQGARTLEPVGSQLSPHGKHVFHLTRDLMKAHWRSLSFGASHSELADFSALGKWMEKCKSRLCLPLPSSICFGEQANSGAQPRGLAPAEARRTPMPPRGRSAP